MKHQIKNNSVVCELADNGLTSTDPFNGNSVKPYETPTLIVYGDVRDITLGATVGFGESGDGFAFFTDLPPPI